MSTPDPAFEPLNDLEHALVATQSGALAIPDFMARLLAGPVYLLLDKQFADGAPWDRAANPLLLENREGQPLLALFTAAMRTGDWPQRAPRFGFGMKITDVADLLRRIPAGVGIVLNPGWTVGLEMGAADVAELRQRGASN